MKNKILKTCLLSVAIFVCLTVALLAACTPKTVTKTEEKFVGTYRESNGHYTLEIKQDNTLKKVSVYFSSEEEYVWKYLEETDQIFATVDYDDGTSYSLYFIDFTYNSSGKCIELYTKHSSMTEKYVRI